MKNVLVVGGAGYVGGAVTDLLLESDYNFRVYDSLLFESEYLKPVDFVYGDIREDKKLQPHLDWADCVIWLAALVADGSCDLYPELAVELNQHCVQWLVDHFEGRIIFPSTALVYAIQDDVLTEDSPKDPQTIYTKTKLAAEEILLSGVITDKTCGAGCDLESTKRDDWIPGQARDDKKDVRYRINNVLLFRLSTLFGLGDRFSRPRLDLVTNLLTARAVFEKKMTVFGGTQYRPFLHVKDVAMAMVENIATDHTGIFNIHKENMTILDLAKKIKEHIPASEIIVKDESRETTGDYRMSSDKARTHLGFDPRCTIDHGIQEIKELIETGRLKDIRNPRYSNEAFLRICPPL